MDDDFPQKSKEDLELEEMFMNAKIFELSEYERKAEKDRIPKSHQKQTRHQQLNYLLKQRDKTDTEDIRVIMSKQQQYFSLNNLHDPNTDVVEVIGDKTEQRVFKMLNFVDGADQNSENVKDEELNSPVVENLMDSPN